MAVRPSTEKAAPAPPLTGLVAADQLAFATLRHCGASLALERGFGIRRCRR